MYGAKYEFVLVPDQDAAGLGGWDEEKKKDIKGWKQHITEALEKRGGRYCVINTPDKMDPDEAFLSGWWPSIIQALISTGGIHRAKRKVEAGEKPRSVLCVPI